MEDGGVMGCREIIQWPVGTIINYRIDLIVGIVLWRSDGSLTAALANLRDEPITLDPPLLDLGAQAPGPNNGSNVR